MKKLAGILLLFVSVLVVSTLAMSFNGFPGEKATISTEGPETNTPGSQIDEGHTTIIIDDSYNSDAVEYIFSLIDFEIEEDENGIIIHTPEGSEEDTIPDEPNSPISTEDNSEFPTNNDSEDPPESDPMNQDDPEEGDDNTANGNDPYNDDNFPLTPSGPGSPRVGGSPSIG